MKKMKILDFLNSFIINLVVTHKNSPTWHRWMKKHWKKFIAVYISRLFSFDRSKNWRSWTFFKGFKITLTVLMIVLIWLLLFCISTSIWWHIIQFVEEFVIFVIICKWVFPFGCRRVIQIRSKQNQGDLIKVRYKNWGWIGGCQDEKLQIIYYPSFLLTPRQQLK